MRKNVIFIDFVRHGAVYFPQICADAPADFADFYLGDDPKHLNTLNQKNLRNLRGNLRNLREIHSLRPFNTTIVWNG